jgi:hypothetical protein
VYDLREDMRCPMDAQRGYARAQKGVAMTCFSGCEFFVCVVVGICTGIQ